MDSIISDIRAIIPVSYERIYSILSPYEDIILDMSSDSTVRLIEYVVSQLSPISKHIGMYSAQSLLHGITQSSLSGKMYEFSEYLPIMDILEMRSSNSMCHISGEDSVVARLQHVTMKDLIMKVDTCTKPIWVDTDVLLSMEDVTSYGTHIILDKSIMSRHYITMSNIRTAVCDQTQYTKEVSYSPNYDASIYIDNFNKRFMPDILRAVDIVTVSGISGLKIISDERGRYHCHSKHLHTLSTMKDITVKCNDVRTTYDILGHDACKNLIIESLMSNQGISLQCASLICSYMMISGVPKPFTKAHIKHIYGPMFDMYYGKPQETIAEWILNHELEDLCVSPYTRLMVRKLL